MEVGTWGMNSTFNSATFDVVPMEGVGHYYVGAKVLFIPHVPPP